MEEQEVQESSSYMKKKRKNAGDAEEKPKKIRKVI